MSTPFAGRFDGLGLPIAAPQAPRWEDVAGWAAERIRQYHEQMESLTLDERNTAVIRGRIAELRDLLRLDARPDPAA